jgi:hypothetical protein
MINVTIDADMTKTPQFKEQLRGIIAELKKAHKDALNSANDRGRDLKASPLANMIAQGNLTYEYLMGEFPKIANKESRLPRAQREVIGTIVYNAAQRTVIMLQAERSEQIKAKANARAAAEDEVTTETSEV